MSSLQKKGAHTLPSVQCNIILPKILHPITPAPPTDLATRALKDSTPATPAHGNLPLTVNASPDSAAMLQLLEDESEEDCAGFPSQPSSLPPPGRSSPGHSSPGQSTARKSKRSKPNKRKGGNNKNF